VSLPHERLVAYSASAALADELHTLVAGWPRDERWDLGRQLTRAADSIGANIAEAYGRWRPDDKKRLLVIARGSYFETHYWLARARARGLLERDYRDRLNEIGKALNGLIRAQRARNP
jgi:four helix bundle protein